MRRGDAQLAGPRVGVLALQGDFQAHRALLERLGAEVVEVRVPEQLQDLDGLVIPGGESTVMMLGIEREGLGDPLRELADAGTPVLATCAGMIVLDRNHLGIMDLVTARNAFGRQVRSFEADLEIADVPGGPVRAVFIRAPWIAEHGPEVELLAAVEGHGVAARSGKQLLALSFHPELTGEPRLHELFLERVRAVAQTGTRGRAGERRRA